MSKSGGMGCGGRQKGGKARSGGGDIKITRKAKLLTEQDTLVRIRGALFADDGSDRDVTAKMPPVMLNYKKNGLNASIKFYAGRVPAKAKLFAFRCAKENMEDLYDDSGYGWDDEDKRRELGEKACRFLVAYDEDDESKNPIAFVNFRFTTQGEYCNCRGGDPCLFIYDIHVANTHQRKGLGKHLMMLVCLISNQTNMDSVCVPVVNGDEVAKSFFLNNLSGFYVDKMTEHPAIAVELMDDGTYVMLSKKKKVVPNVVAPKPPVTPTKNKVEAKASSPDSVVSPPAPPTDATTTGQVQPSMSFNLSGLTENLPTAEDIEAEHLEGDELEPEMSAEDIVLESLMEEFERRNGREATDEEVKMWTDTIREANGEAAVGSGVEGTVDIAEKGPEPAAE